MSKNHNEIIKCPECQTEGDFKVWESINTSDDPELKELIRSGQLFMWKCPKCGNDCIVFYPTYYHQPEDKVLIHYIPDAPFMAINFMKTLTHDPYDESIKLEKGCRKRVVTDMNSFREKLLILDHGYDDRIIELQKIFLIAELQKAEPTMKIEQVFFNKEKDGTTNFAVKTDGDHWGRAEFSSGTYENIAKSFKTALDADKEVLINSDWALALIEKDIS